jgi:hypothetical protein
MSKECSNLCTGCQYRTVEFVISFGGPDRVTSGDICGLDLPGYPQKTSCIGFEPKRRARVFAPSAAQYSTSFAAPVIAELEASAVNG